MTRKETKEWAESIVHKIFHGHHKKTTIEGWVARDKTGSLFFYDEKPHKSPIADWWLGKFIDTESALFRSIDTHFPIKWEDTEPTKAKITIEIE